MAVFRTEKPQQTGIALGGIGTGSVELQPDGEFHFWQIANQSKWGGQCEQWKMDDGERHTGALSFYARCETDEGGVVFRKLSMNTRIEDFTYRMFAWNKPVEAIEYEGRFPVCTLKYIDKKLPVSLTLRAVAPFVPHDSDISSTPGFILDFDIIANEDANISLLGSLEPSFADKKRCQNVLTEKGDITAVSIYPTVKDEEPDTGDLTFSISGDCERSYITAEHFRFLREFVSHSEYGLTQESFLFGFRESGRLPDTKIGTAPEAIPKELSALSDSDMETLADSLSEYPMAKSLLERMERLSPGFPSCRKDREGLIRYMARQIRDIGDDFGSAALCGSVKLKKGERRTVRFCLSWYFPNHFSRFGVKMGHYYENLYKNSLEANLTLTERPDIANRAVAFSDLLFDTSAPDCYPEGWSAHLSTIVKDSWHLKNGKFGLWEGLGSCGFHTTDITYHASFGLLSLFPELQLGQMLMGAEFQREDGRVHHFLTPDLEHHDDSFERVDMNPQFVLMVCRDYLFTGDRGYLEKMWDHVTAAIDSIKKLDRNGDGLPDVGTGSNTYDAWKFSGTPTYISILWLAALKAACVIAGAIGDEARIREWDQLLGRGSASLEKLLWNGKYYDLWRSEDRVDGSLMTDQLDGEWFLRASGIGSLFPDGRVKAVLSFIFEHNFDPEDGLVNASCPEGASTSLFTYKNCQAKAVWTGIGYAFAALCLTVGLDDTAETQVRSIHENQSRMGAFWSHWECGAYYTRPLSSWSTLNALLGLRIDAENKKLALDPKINGRLPLIIPGFIGHIDSGENKCEITALEGSLEGFEISAKDRAVILK